MNDLYTRSIEIIKANQTPGGAYLASPTFDQYRYCWFRDGAYIAYAMDLVGEHDSASRFYDWAAENVASRAAQVERAVAAASGGKMPAPSDLLDTRYTVSGEPSTDEWPNFQMDGFGTLLWGMGRHISLASRPLPQTWYDASVLLVRYLSALWAIPCYDCWEEFPDKLHSATLAALYGGLEAAAQMLGTAQRVGELKNRSEIPDPAAMAIQWATYIKGFVLEECVSDGTLCKFVGSAQVDGSLITAAIPYNLLSPDDPIMTGTVKRIEAELRRESGGVHRYADDSYYGGGEWILLTAYLGWHYAETGDKGRAEALLSWVEDQANAKGELPEQVPCHLNHPDMLSIWEKRWGLIATPLLWSHAAYLTLATHLKMKS